MTQDRIPLDAGSSRPAMEGETLADHRINGAELEHLFPSGVPLIAVKIMFPEQSHPLTIAEMRQVLSALSALPPAPAVEGCKCQSCGLLYRADLIVPDDVWEKISPSNVDGYKGGGLLCPSCIMHRIIEAKIWTVGFANGDTAPAVEGVEPDIDWMTTAHVFCDRLGIERNADAFHIASAISRLVKERDDALRYATRLLVSLMEKHYPDRSPNWAPLPDLIGVLTQIDNMSTGLARVSQKGAPVDRFGMIDEASGHEPLYFGRVNGIQPWGISGEQYVRLSDYQAAEASVARLTALLAEADAQRTRQEERVRVLEEALRKALQRTILDDDGGNWTPEDIGHPRHINDTRDEIELFLRDAYASGCRAAQTRSLFTAVEYAARHAPELRNRLAALGNGGGDAG